MSGRAAVLFSLLLAALGCGDGPSAVSMAPDLRGTWSTSLSWPVSYVSTPSLLRSSSGCTGSLLVESQEGERFSGRFRQDAPCDAEGAVIEGHVSANGKVTFRLQAEHGSPFATSDLVSLYQNCELLSDEELHTGDLSTGILTTTRDMIFFCPDIGRVVVSLGFRGQHQPS